MQSKKISPWSWIPTLYIAEGLPYFAVNVLTVIMYTNMGISVAEMTFFTGWLYLPWVIKPFWSPFVDLFGSKRGWVLAMQLCICITMAAVGLLLPTSFFFKGTLIAFWIMAFCSATHDIAADGYYMLALDSHDQAKYVGLRSTFYRIASVIGQGGLVYAAGVLENKLLDIPAAWSIIFFSLSAFFLLLMLWHCRFMPKVTNDRAIEGVTAKTILKDFFNTFVTFFQRPHIVSGLAFMLLYRLPEAFCVKLVQPFMLASRDIGGLGMSTEQVGIVNGTIGVIALLAGGIIGGIAIAKGGLRKWLWPMALSLTLPCLFYCILAAFQPQSIAVISIAVFLEQFGYGFGFSAFMLYLIYFCQGENKTSHYAFCTAFMALGMMIPGMAAGQIYEIADKINFFSALPHPGFLNFFWWVMLCCCATFAVCLSVKINPHFGKKNTTEIIEE